MLNKKKNLHEAVLYLENKKYFVPTGANFSSI